MDDRDRLILSLCVLLRAERETRAAFEAVIRSGQLSGDVLTAMLSDPVPAITGEDLVEAETLMTAQFIRNSTATFRVGGKSIGEGGSCKTQSS